MQDRVVVFDIQKESKIDPTFRVEKIKNDYDLKVDQIQERFTGQIELPETWNIGVIVGNSGTGKTTIARKIFGDKLVQGYEYKSKSVIDDMPESAQTNDIANMFNAVGFASVPSWLKPYDVLSNGEKMRVDLARALLSDDLIVFDEFTSVVDRRVAETMCLATNRSVKRLKKQFVAVSCHYDVLEWLQPDWYFDTNEMKCFFQYRHDQKKNSWLKDAPLMRGEYSRSITI